MRETVSVEGHAVRALYLFAGATDQAIEDRDEELLARCEAVFADLLATKTYVTGGMGARWDWEAFGDPYEMTTDRGYAETCAAIGAIQWAWRLLLATGKPQYADAIERLLFNAFLAGVSLAGTEFFYVNSLQLRDGAIADEGRSIIHGRRGWFDCACCPPNVMRTLSSLDQYLATADETGLQLHQYASGTLSGGGLEIAVETEYPHRGRVRIRVLAAPEEARTLSLRVPAWAAGATVTTSEGEREARPGTLPLQRVFVPGEEIVLDLPMTARFVRAPHRADASRGAVALERGPLVYALEQADQQGTERVDDALVDPAAPVTEQVLEDLDGVIALDLPGAAAAAPEDGVSYLPWDAPSAAPTPHAWRAIPYYAWANREIGPMRVWLPVVPRG